MITAVSEMGPYLEGAVTGVNIGGNWSNIGHCWLEVPFISRVNWHNTTHWGCLVPVVVLAGQLLQGLKGERIIENMQRLFLAVRLRMREKLRERERGWSCLSCKLPLTCIDSSSCYRFPRCRWCRGRHCSGFHTNSRGCHRELEGGEKEFVAFEGSTFELEIHSVKDQSGVMSRRYYTWAVNEVLCTEGHQTVPWESHGSLESSNSSKCVRGTAPELDTQTNQTLSHVKIYSPVVCAWALSVCVQFPGHEALRNLSNSLSCKSTSCSVYVTWLDTQLRLCLLPFLCWIYTTLARYTRVHCCVL